MKASVDLNSALQRHFAFPHVVPKRLAGQGLVTNIVEEIVCNLKTETYEFAEGTEPFSPFTLPVEQRAGLTGRGKEGGGITLRSDRFSTIPRVVVKLNTS